ncbi:MAG: undecaprenyl-diphosphate phosphatase [Deltaproteobacteria bacterium]|nr:undecaprenyl-diphosphate phosphatase [Deltaproteobacteria bacterium]
MPLWVAAILGVVEGLTEYLPVSSTAHIQLAGVLLKVSDMPGFASFDIFIQLGAILAVLVEYRELLWARLLGLRKRDPKAIQLFSALIAGFIPAAIVGVIAKNAIQKYLFGITTICIAFVVGGVVMIAVDAWYKRKADRGIDGIDKVTVKHGFVIGLGQLFSLIPGTSRSMSTIVTGQLCGLSTATSAEFSFLLGLITLGAATVYTGFKDRHELMVAGGGAMVVGVVVSFFVAWAVIHGFIRYLQKRGLAPFGYYRIALAALVWITLR